MNWPIEIPEIDTDNKKIYLINVKGGNYRCGKDGPLNKQLTGTIVYSCDGQFYVSTWLHFSPQSIKK